MAPTQHDQQAGDAADDWSVSVVVPTLNSSGTLRSCLESVRAQTLSDGRVELIVVDGGSSDASLAIAGDFADTVLHFDRSDTLFSATHQRNLGASKARGSFVYYVDADMILPEGLLEECCSLCAHDGFDAVIVFEQSFGSTFWADVKRVERDSYRGNDIVEAPRFIRRSTWRQLGGLDTSIGGGGDDWDLHLRLRAAGAKIGRSETSVLHDEGALSLRRLARKRFLYSKELMNFLGRHGLATTATHYSPFSRGYGRAVLATRPRFRYVAGLVLMRTVEYGAGGAGLAVGLARKLRNGGSDG